MRAASMIGGCLAWASAWACGVVGLAACGGSGGDASDARPADAPASTADAQTTGTGCDGIALLDRPADPTAPGPWPVGARTVTIGRLTVEVWYPAEVGSSEGLTPARYDIRQALNPSSRDLVPDADNPWQDCDCYRDLPFDASHGPYPVIVFVHGTAAFRHQSLHQTAHWASRGFVVVAADHPGLMLGDLLASLCPDDPTGAQDLSGDVDAMLAALAAPTGDLAFLASHVAIDRVGVVGHSAGGAEAARSTAKPGVRVVASLAGNAEADDGPALERVVFMGGTSDGIVDFGAVTGAWEGSATPNHLIGIAGAGHLMFSDLCDTTNSSGQNLLEVAEQYDICGANFASFLFDCSPRLLSGQLGWDITNYATTAAFESVLQCRADAPAISTIADHFDVIEPYIETP